MTDVAKLETHELEGILKKAVGDYRPSFEIMQWKTGASVRFAVTDAHKTAKGVLLDEDTRITKKTLAKHIINMYHAYQRLEKAYKDRPVREVPKPCLKFHGLGEYHILQLLDEVTKRVKGPGVYGMVKE